MNKNILPKARFLSNPFVSGFTDIDQEKISFKIGTSLENITFLDEDYFPEYITCLCNIIPKTNFENIKISTSSKEPPFQIYSSGELQMKDFVSGVDFECYDILSDSKIPEELDDILTTNIFTKEFKTQKVSKTIELFDDGNSGYRSKAYFFAGRYFRGINIPDIQQHMFFIGIDTDQQKYIKIISSSELLNSNDVLLSDEIQLESLSNIKDDVACGKIQIKISEDISYTALDISKETVVSNVCRIVLKKSQNVYNKRRS